MRVNKEQNKNPYCPDKTIIQKDTSTPTFTAALLTTARTWKQPKHASTEEWIKTMWCIHTHTHTHKGILLGHKKEQNGVTCRDVDRPRDCHTE